MLGFSSTTAVDFLPSEDTRAWVAAGLSDHWSRLGAAGQEPRVVTKTAIEKPRDLDDLFELMCGVQAQVGQADVEFSLVELTSEDSPLKQGYQPLGDPAGHLMHTFVKRTELVVAVVPEIFRVSELVLASAARELGRIAVHRAGGHGHTLEPADYEGDAELAAIALGLGVWVANGAYVYESACCGGGCGLDLKSLRAGLSMPESCFGLAVDSQRKGISRRAVAKYLESTQRAAFKRSWGWVRKQPALAAPPQVAALGA